MHKFLILFIVTGLLVAAVFTTFLQQTVNFSAIGPTQATAGVAVQFQGPATLSGGLTPGSLWGTDSIVGNLRYVPAEEIRTATIRSR